MKNLFILALGLLAGALAPSADARPPRMEYMADIRNVAQELKNDTQDLQATASTHAPQRNGRDFERRGDRGSSRALADLEALSRAANELDYAIDRNGSTPAYSETYYTRYEQSYQRVLAGFADASLLNRSNAKSDLFRIIKNTAKLRYYYEVAEGGWIGGTVRLYSEKLDESANRLASEIDRQRRHQDRDLADASDRFSSFAANFRKALREDYGRIDTSRDEFFRLKQAFENLQNVLNTAMLADEVIGDTLAVLDHFHSVSVYYTMLSFNPKPQYGGYGSGAEQVPRHGNGRWMHEQVTEKAQKVAAATANLGKALQEDFDVIFGGGGKKAAVHAVAELDNQLKLFNANLRTRRDSPRDTFEDLKQLDQKSDQARIRLRDAGLSRYLAQINEIDRGIEELGQMYEYNRPARR